jgi:hypothetical protein
LSGCSAEELLRLCCNSCDGTFYLAFDVSLRKGSEQERKIAEWNEISLLQNCRQLRMVPFNFVFALKDFISNRSLAGQQLMKN